MPEEALETSREEVHRLTAARPILDVAAGERRQLVRDVREALLARMPVQDVERVVARADDRPRLVRGARRDHRGAARLAESARPDGIGGGCHPAIASDV